jgi:hypothetical protein
MRGLWWTKRHWVKFSPSTSVSPANYLSTNFSIIIFTRGLYNRPLVAAVPSGTNWAPPPTISIKKNMEPGVPFPAASRNLSHLHSVHPGCTVHPTSYAVNTADLFQGVKRPRREADIPPGFEVMRTWSCTSILPYVFTNSVILDVLYVPERGFRRNT